jgi:hypothetical protein
MSSAPIGVLREIPPFQDALAVPKDFKIIFDAGA